VGFYVAHYPVWKPPFLVNSRGIFAECCTGPGDELEIEHNRPCVARIYTSASSAAGKPRPCSIRLQSTAVTAQIRQDGRRIRRTLSSALLGTRLASGSKEPSDGNTMDDLAPFSIAIVLTSGLVRLRLNLLHVFLLRYESRAPISPL
jgi:hypothetical protein